MVDPVAPLAGFIAGVEVAGDDLAGGIGGLAAGAVGILVAVAVKTVAPAVFVLAIADSIKHNDALLGRCL